MASITTTTTKTGDRRYRVRYRDPSGSTREKWFQRKVDADRFAATTEADIVRGQWLDPALSRMTLDTWATEWLTGKSHRKPKTFAGYESLLRVHVLPAFGEQELRQVRTNAVKQWLSQLQNSGLSASRVRQAYQVLNSCLEAAVEDDRIAKNPARAARGDLPSLENREMLFLTHEQVQALTGAVPEEWRTLILTLAYSGIRWGEAAALRRSRCLLLENKLHIKESLSEVGGVLHLGPPKSNKPRWVSIPGFLTELIAKHLYRQPDGNADPMAFTSPTGLPLRHSNFYSRIWKPAVREADLPTGLRIHDLRHTAAAFMIDEGAHLELVRQQLGHSSITVTQKYAHLYPSATDDLAARLDDRYRQLQQQPVGLVWG